MRLVPEAGEAAVPIEVEGTVVLGREDCDVILDDSEVSRQHVRLTANAGGVTVEDLNSTNGTYVNGRPISEATVMDSGGVLKVGQSRWRLEGVASKTQLGASPPPQATPAPPTPQPPAPKAAPPAPTPPPAERPPQADQPAKPAPPPPKAQPGEGPPPPKDAKRRGDVPAPESPPSAIRTAFAPSAQLASFAPADATGRRGSAGPRSAAANAVAYGIVVLTAVLVAISLASG